MLIGDQVGTWYDISGRVNLGEHAFKPLLLEERRGKFSFSFGDLELVQIIMPDIYIVFGDIALQNPYFQMRAEEMPDMVEMHFTLKGNGAFNNEATGTRYNFDANRHSLMYMPAFDGKACYMEREKYVFFEVHFSRQHFLDLVRDTNPALYKFAEQVDLKKEVLLGQDSGEITFAMHQCIREIMDCRFSGGLKKLFLQAKCIELLTLQVTALEKRTVNKTTLTSAYDKDCIMYAREYLQAHITAPPSLAELAAIAGTNTFKLKNGFKELFNNTVFGYLSEVRLEQARELLLTGIPIKDVADRTGYSSVQHFSTAFRKKFGISPGKLHQSS